MQDDHPERGEKGEHIFEEYMGNDVISLKLFFSRYRRRHIEGEFNLRNFVTSCIC